MPWLSRPSALPALWRSQPLPGTWLASVSRGYCIMPNVRESRSSRSQISLRWSPRHCCSFSLLVSVARTMLAWLFNVCLMHVQCIFCLFLLCAVFAQCFSNQHFQTGQPLLGWLLLFFLQGEGTGEVSFSSGWPRPLQVLLSHDGCWSRLLLAGRQLCYSLGIHGQWQ